MFERLRKRSPSSTKLELPHFEQPRKHYEAVIHIGAPKTGSSAIQRFLLENRKILQKHGFYYPEHELDENGISGGHSILGLNVAKDNLPEARALFESWLTQAKQRNLTLLISAESLFNHPEKLKKITTSCQCRIFSFYRDPVDAIYSNYNQSIKRHFTTSTFKQVCERFLRTDSDFFSGRIFTRWAETFGDNNLVLFAYDSDLFAHTPIQAVFLAMLGIRVTDIRAIAPKSVQYINRSYSPAALELKRMLNYVLDQENNKLNNEIDWFLQRLSDESEHHKPNLQSLLDPDVYELLIERFRIPLQHAVRNFVPPALTETLMDFQEKDRQQFNRIEELIEFQTIIESIRSYKPELHDYIISKTRDALGKGLSNYSLFKLGEILNIEHYNPDAKDPWFTNIQLDNMAAGKYLEADYLILITNLLFLRKEFKAAHKLSTRALELRPGGPVIIELNQRIEQKLEEALETNYNTCLTALKSPHS